MVVKRSLKYKKKHRRKQLLKSKRVTRRRLHKRHRGGGEKTIDIVVSRYKEELEWLNLYKNRGFHKIHIYNKSDTEIKCPDISNPMTQCEVYKIPNVGVCDHTYLYHIVHHYGSLADITIFTPGSSDMDHKSKLVESTINRVFQTKDSVFNTYEFNVDVAEAMYNFTMNTYPTGYKSNQNTNEEAPQTLANIRPFGAWYHANFPGAKPTKSTFFGIMAVSKELIHRRPKSFYEGLLSQVDKDKFHEASHFMERAYTGMFDPVPEETMVVSDIILPFIDHPIMKGYRDLRRY